MVVVTENSLKSSVASVNIGNHPHKQMLTSVCTRAHVSCLCLRVDGYAFTKHNKRKSLAWKIQGAWLHVACLGYLILCDPLDQSVRNESNQQLLLYAFL